MHIQRRKEAGQSAVLVSLLLIVLTVIIAFTTNIGKLVTEKIAMQNAVDMAAYSGAATQAGALNEMRNINQQMWQIHQTVRMTFMPSEMTVGFPYYDPSQISNLCVPPMTPNINPAPVRSQIADQYIRGMEQAHDALERQFKLVNETTGPMAVERATRDAADANYKGTRQKVTFFSPNSKILPVKQDKIHWDYKGWSMNIPPYPCTLPSGPIGSMRITHHDADSWMFRDTTRGETMVAIGIENAVPATGFVGSGSHGIMKQYFSSQDCVAGSAQSGRCPLNVYAAAHPHFGKIGSRHPNSGGRSSWEQQWDSTLNRQSQNMVDLASDLQDHMPQRNKYYDYKVRFIGIFENEAQFLGGQRLTSAIPNGNKMKH